MIPRIIGNTVGMGLPKPNLMQSDPTKGDYIKGKDSFLEKVSDIIDESISNINVELDGVVKTVNGVGPDEAGNVSIDINKELQADWNQNDENAPDYLKNRTHWEEETMVILIPDTTVNISTNGGYTELSKNCPILTKGKTYIVTLNGVTYECIARTHNNCVIIGNGTIDGDGVNVNNEPFMIDSYASGAIYLNVKTAGKYTVSVQTAETIIHTIDPKYLPDSAYGSGGSGIDVTAAVGQTIVVKEVDANGKPTKWVAAEYQPRTHWSEETVILPETTVKIDPEAGIGLIPAEFTLVGGKAYTVKYNGVDYANCECLEVEGQVILGNIGAIDEGSFPVTEHPFVIAYTPVDEDEHGSAVFTWVCVALDGSTSITLSIWSEYVHKISEKFIDPSVFYVDTYGKDTLTTEVTYGQMKNALDRGMEIKMRIFNSPNKTTQVTFGHLDFVSGYIPHRAYEPCLVRFYCYFDNDKHCVDLSVGSQPTADTTYTVTITM